MKNEVKDLTKLKEEAVVAPANPNQIRVRSLEPIKFKERSGRSRVIIDLKQAFGFLPEIIVLDKVHGTNNKIQLHAQLTDEFIKHMNEMVKSKQNLENAKEHVKALKKTNA